MIDAIVISDARKGNGLDLTLATISSMYYNFSIDTYMESLGADEFGTIFIVESDPSIDYGKLLKSTKPELAKHVKTVRPKGEFNYNNYINQVLPKCKGDHIMFCNNDLIFEYGWNDGLIMAMAEASEAYGKPVLSASPFCPLSQGKEMGMQVERFLVGYEIRKHVSGWCIFVDKKLIKLIGGKLRDNVEFWFSDNVYADQLKEAELLHALATRSIVHHVGGGSNTIKTIEVTERSKLTYLQQNNYLGVKKEDLPSEGVAQKGATVTGTEGKDPRFN